MLDTSNNLEINNKTYFQLVQSHSNPTKEKKTLNNVFLFFKNKSKFQLKLAICYPRMIVPNPKKKRKG